MVNLSYNKNRLLPSAEELPCSDETAVDNQLQNDIPNLLLSLLAFIWAERDDWYFGADRGTSKLKSLCSMEYRYRLQKKISHIYHI